jgi:hypothetical protein
VNITNDTTETEFDLATGDPNKVRTQFRHARVTPAGTFLVAHFDMNKVIEYEAIGKQVWSIQVPSPWSAVRLKNGNTLVTGKKNFVREVDPAGKIVWELTQADVPDIKLFNTQTAVRLVNGNTLVNNWQNKIEGNLPVQWIEVTPDKKLVWALRSWDDPSNLGPATNIQILDEPGVAENAELQR